MLFPRSNCGFTVVELIVGLAIISVLVVSGTIAYRGYMAKIRCSQTLLYGDADSDHRVGSSGPDLDAFMSVMWTNTTMPDVDASQIWFFDCDRDNDVDGVDFACFRQNADVATFCNSEGYRSKFRFDRPHQIPEEGFGFYGNPPPAAVVNADYPK